MGNNSELSGEPALWAALITSTVQMVAAFWLPLSDGMVVGINAAALAGAGVVVAFMTRSADNGGSVKAAILGFTQAVLSLAVTFGADFSPQQTATVMTFVGLLVAFWVRHTSLPKSAADPKPGPGLHAGQDLAGL